MNEESNLAEYLLLMEEKLNNPELRTSQKEIEDLLSDNFVEFGSSGKVYDKQLVLKALKNETGCKISITDFRVTELADNVSLVNYVAVKENDQNEKSFSLRSSVWKKNSNKWQIVFHQSTIKNNYQF